MRRALAAAILGISLWIGSLAWTGFIMTRTVLDPGRSEAVADALLEDDEVRAQLSANFARAIAAAVPEGAPVDDADIDAAATAALASPQIEALVRSAFVQTHQAFLGEGEPPEAIQVTAPTGATIDVALPTERVPDLGGLRRALDTVVPVLAGVAAFGAVLALVVTSNRPAILRRAGIWALCLSLFVLAFAYGVPALAQEFAPNQAAVVASLVAALAEASRGPAIVLAAAGLGGILASIVWKPTMSTIGARAGTPASATTPRQARQPRRDVPVSKRRPPAQRSSNPRPAPQTSAMPPPQSPPTGPMRPPAAVDPTVAQPSVPASAPTSPERANARWVEGVGWVHDGPEPIPEGARWVPGVGYVVDPQ